MKINLGKVFLYLFIIFNIQLIASEYKWSASINKKSAFINEPIYLKYICEFNDSGSLYTIDFNPIGKFEKYNILVLKEDEKIINNKRINTYEYIAYVKEKGKVDFDFDVVMKKTTQDSIVELTGGMDNDMEMEQFFNTYLKQKLLSVNIQESKSSLLGDFNIKIKKDKLIKKAFSPFHLEIKINGSGNFQDIKDIKFDINNVKVFSQKPTQELSLTKQGYTGTWSQKFAFVADKDFSIEEFKIEYMNPEDALKKNLIIKKIDVKVTKAYEKENLLDKEEEIFEFSYDYLYLILSFISGFILAKIKFKKEKTIDNDSILFKEKLNNVKSLDELLIILVLQDCIKYDKIIKEIENKQITSLAQAKKSIFSS